MVRDSSDCLLEDIICYPPGKGFIATAESARRSGTFENASARSASVSQYSPCKGERGPRPEYLRNDPASDWVLLAIHDPTFRHQHRIKALYGDNLSTDQTFQVIGFPGGALDWTSGDIVNAVTVKDFRPRADSEPGIVDYHGPEETRPGMSGGGIFADNGALVGIHRSNTDAVLKRGGIRATAIVRQLRENHQIEFLQEFCPSPDSGPPIDRAKKQLRCLLMDFELADNLCDLVRNEFKRMEEMGGASDDQELFEKIRNAFRSPDEWEALVIFLHSLERKRRNTDTGPDYAKLAKQLSRGEVVLCLGQEISHLFGAPIPSTAEIKKHLSKKDFHGPLSELCEQKLIAPDSSRTDLVNELRELLDQKGASVALYDFLAELRQPVIVISSGYDELLQQSLRVTQREFVEIYPNMENGKSLLVYSDRKEGTLCSPDEISSYNLLENGYSIIYRLRGGIVDCREDLLLSERDYLIFNRLPEQFPEYISSRLKSSLYSLWFIGHYPQSWEERLLVEFLKELQHKNASSIAVQENIPPFAKDFWHFKKVTAYDLALTEFVRELEAAL